MRRIYFRFCLDSSQKYDAELFRIWHTPCNKWYFQESGRSYGHASNPNFFPRMQATTIRQIMLRLQFHARLELLPPRHSRKRAHSAQPCRSLQRPRPVQPVLDRCSVDAGENCG